MTLQELKQRAITSQATLRAERFTHLRDMIVVLEATPSVHASDMLDFNNMIESYIVENLNAYDDDD